MKFEFKTIKNAAAELSISESELLNLILEREIKVFIRVHPDESVWIVVGQFINEKSFPQKEYVSDREKIKSMARASLSRDIEFLEFDRSFFKRFVGGNVVPVDEFFVGYKNNKDGFEAYVPESIIKKIPDRNLLGDRLKDEPGSDWIPLRHRYAIFKKDEGHRRPSSYDHREKVDLTCSRLAIKASDLVALLEEDSGDSELENEHAVSEAKKIAKYFYGVMPPQHFIDILAAAIKHWGPISPGKCPDFNLIYKDFISPKFGGGIFGKTLAKSAANLITKSYPKTADFGGDENVRRKGRVEIKKAESEYGFENTGFMVFCGLFKKFADPKTGMVSQNNLYRIKGAILDEGGGDIYISDSLGSASTKKMVYREATHGS